MYKVFFKNNSPSRFRDDVVDVRALMKTESAN